MKQAGAHHGHELAAYAVMDALERLAGNPVADKRIVGVQQWLSERVTIDFNLRVIMMLETLHDHQIDRSHSLQQFVERGLGCAAQLVHQRPTLSRGDHHLPRTRLPMEPGVLARLIDVKGMMGMLYRGYGDSARNELRYQRRHQGRLSASAPPREAKDPHCRPPYALNWGMSTAVAMA